MMTPPNRTQWSRARAWAATLAAALCTSAHAQCGDWEPVGVPPVTSVISSAIEWDPDGVGPRESLLVVGGFSQTGDISAPLAAWDGSQWSSLNAPQAASPMGAMATYQGELVVYNQSPRLIQRLSQNGAWTTLGASPTFIQLMASDEDNLYVYASNLLINGQAYPNRFAMYDGTSWSPIPGTPNSGGSSGFSIQSMAVWNHNLVISGTFDSISGHPFNRLAMWDGASWQSLAWDQAVTPKVGVSQDTLFAVGTNVRRWTGTAWDPVAPDSFPGWNPISGTATADVAFTDTGVFLYEDSPGISHVNVLQFDGEVWATHPEWRGWPPHFLTTWRGQLVGTFSLDTQRAAIAVEREGAWHPLGDGVTEPPTALANYQGALAVGGIVGAGGHEAGGVAVFDGGDWDDLSGGIPGFTHGDIVTSLAARDGSLYVGGQIWIPWINNTTRSTGMWKWDGLQWQQAPGDWLRVDAMVMHDGNLVASGQRYGQSAPQIAVLTGGVWQTIASPGSAEFMRSSADRLYIAGNFTSVGGIAAPGVAAWDGETWTALAQRPMGAYPIETYRGTLVTTGYFGPLHVWNGTEWLSIPALYPFNSNLATAFGVYNDEIIAAGPLIYRWADAHGYRPMGTDAINLNSSSTNTPVQQVGSSVYFSGSLHHIQTAFSAFLMRWTDQPTCDCDTIDFNRDGLFPDTADVPDFLSVFQGGDCAVGWVCNTDLDFNNDGLTPDTLDIAAFLSTFAGGPCLQ